MKAAHLIRTTRNLVRVNLSDSVDLHTGMADSTRTNTPTSCDIIIASGNNW